jgi:hypothetical protein
MPSLIYMGITLLIAAVDSFYRESAGYTVINIVLRVIVLLPLLSVIIRGTSGYARMLRRTLWLVMVADILLPLSFPAGMIAFLFVHIFNALNFYHHIEFRRGRIWSIVAPGAMAYGVSLLLYGYFLYTSMDDVYRVLVGLYLVPIALAWSLSITCGVQNRSRWSLVAAAGMSLFFCTDFQVAARFLANIQIPSYGLVNALSYYGGLLLLSVSSQMIEED